MSVLVVCFEVVQQTDRQTVPSVHNHNFYTLWLRFSPTAFDRSSRLGGFWLLLFLWYRYVSPNTYALLGPNWRRVQQHHVHPFTLPPVNQAIEGLNIEAAMKALDDETITSDAIKELFAQLSQTAKASSARVAALPSAHVSMVELQGDKKRLRARLDHVRSAGDGFPAKECDWKCH